MEMLKLTQIIVIEGKRKESTVYIAKHAIVSVCKCYLGTRIITNAIQNAGGCAIENAWYDIKETPEEICNMIG